METEPQGTEPTTFEPEPTSTGSGGDDNTMAMLGHLAGIIAIPGFIVPLVLWLTNKDKPGKDFLVDQSKEALNFQITVMIAFAVVMLLEAIVPASGWLSWVVWVAVIVFCVMAGIAANRGERYRYPYALRLIT